ncbi:MAG: hypothetical protein M1818_003925 [Claussenomyces sp. TS43310]|nr:MAG: hypothetical protein M1818_003925 [Claussenomyces sp. TS43310]
MASQLKYIESSTWTVAYRGESFLNRNLKRVIDRSATYDGRVRVTYELSITDDFDEVTSRQVTVKGHCCAICNTILSSWNTLRFHLRTNHDAYQISLRRARHRRRKFVVELCQVMREPQPSGLYRETLQIGLSLRRFDLDMYLDGDRSWIANRLGPRDTSGLARVRDPPSSSSFSSSLSSSFSPSPPSFPLLNSRNKVESKRAPLVPHTARPLFDPISKRRLQPGEEVPGSSFRNDAFGLREHAAIIHEFTDVSRDEKDFICRWDAFVLPRMISSNHGIQKAVIEFVKENTDWFTQRESRLRQFGLHATALTLKGTITPDCWKECSDTLRGTPEDANVSSSRQGKEIEPEHTRSGDASIQEWKAIRGSKDCVCGTQPAPSEALFCTGKRCAFPFHHLHCLGFKARTRPSKWLCAGCTR